MPMLTNARHERFAQALAAGKSASEAYEEAGYAANDGNAVRLKGNEKVRARVTELQSRVTEGVVLTKQWVIERLIENANRAMQAKQATSEDGQPLGEFRYEGSVANRALELLGKEVGMFIDRKEIGNPGEFAEIESMNADDLRAFIRAQAKATGLRSDEAEAALGIGAARGKPH